MTGNLQKVPRRFEPQSLDSESLVSLGRLHEASTQEAGRKPAGETRKPAGQQAQKLEETCRGAAGNQQQAKATGNQMETTETKRKET